MEGWEKVKPRDIIYATSIIFSFQKHHFRELSEEAQRIFGSTTESYVKYWLSNFPHLLYHTYLSLQPLKHEPVFSKYYSKTYQFHHNISDEIPTWFYELETSPKKKRTNDECREEWAKSGRESGVWRPRFRYRNRQKNETTEKPPTWTIRFIYILKILLYVIIIMTAEMISIVKSNDIESLIIFIQIYSAKIQFSEQKKHQKKCS